MRGETSKASAAEAATVFERFEAIAGACPGELAYLNGPVALSYSELAAMARAARARILALGPPEPEIVGILTANRVNALAAILGVAGSGHAYVLLDVNDPDKRLGHIAAEARPFAVLADEALATRAARLVARPGAVVDLDNLKVEDGDSQSEPLPTFPDSLLYVSFTSGSTGVPKGVCQTHRNLIFFVDAYIEAMAIGAGDPISWLFAHGVSASNMDIYGALFTGARLCAFEVRNESFEGMARWIDEQGLTLLHTVPTVVRELAGVVATDKVFESVRVVDLAGEMLFASDVVRMRPHFRPDCRILNRLAATEASFIASLAVTKVHERAEGALPVGKPPEGVELMILSGDGSRAETGQTGSIAIDSPHVCTGYLNRPDLNAEAFADVPGRPGWRRYRSADLGFIDEAGNLHFIGRSGSRIKLRGQAVDLAEVEAALYECPGVTGAAVLPSGESGEEAREILAYLTLAPDAAQEAGEIRKQLSQMLPAYMLPSGYVFLDQFPCTATSKVDRQALAALDLDKVRFRPGYVPPENELEEKVAAIFSEVLNAPAVGRLDDFFLLGGDSLSLVNLQILATESFGRQLSELHEDASVKGVAKWLGEAGGDAEIHMPILLPIRTAWLGATVVRRPRAPRTGPCRPAFPRAARDGAAAVRAPGAWPRRKAGTAPDGRGDGGRICRRHQDRAAARPLLPRRVLRRLLHRARNDPVALPRGREILRTAAHRPAAAPRTRAPGCRRRNASEADGKSREIGRVEGRSPQRQRGQRRARRRPRHR